MFRLFLSLLCLSILSGTKASLIKECGIDSVRKDKVVHSLWLTTGLDYVASSTIEELLTPPAPEDKISVHSAIPVNLRYALSFTDPNIRNYFPGGYQGIGLGVLNYGGLQKNMPTESCKNIGYPVLIYVFQGAPFWKNPKGLSLNYEWNFGAAFGWKPYSEANKNFNLIVGSRVNAYLNLGLNLQWQIDPNWGIFGGLTVSHFSNGNTSFPNPGVNSFGMRVGMCYTLNPIKTGFPTAIPDTVKRKKLQYDISVWGASRKRVYKGGENPVLLPGHFACAGLSFAPMVRLNTWWRAGGSADIQWDQSSDKKHTYISGTTSEDIRFRRPCFWRQLTLGLSAHGELQMPVFALNVGIGYNLLAPWENKGSYQNITLKTYLGSLLYLNIGYQLRNFYQMGSLMLGLGVTI